MFRDMRRKKQLLPQEEALAVLERGTNGVMALSGDGGYPYAVPISYAYRDGRLYFHCAKTGHKLDAIARSDKASFCVVDQDQIVPEEFTTYFRSVIAFGRIRVLETEEERRRAAEALCAKYAPGLDSAGEIRKSLPAMGALELTIEHLTGKEAIELHRQRGQG